MNKRGGHSKSSRSQKPVANDVQMGDSEAGDEDIIDVDEPAKSTKRKASVSGKKGR